MLQKTHFERGFEFIKKNVIYEKKVFKNKMNKIHISFKTLPLRKAAKWRLIKSYSDDKLS